MLSHREDRVNGTGPDSTDVGYGWQRAGELEHAAGGGQGDADGVQAPSAGSAAGDRGGAGHAVGLGDWKECQVLRPWNATSRFSSAGVMKNRPRPASCAGSSAR